MSEQTPINNAPPAVPGVVIVPTSAVAKSIQQQAAEYLRLLPPETNGAVLTVETGAGFNLAVAHKSRGGRWGVTTWIGKSGWSEPVSGGVSAQIVW
jgi:hypothetical protein